MTTFRAYNLVVKIFDWAVYLFAHNSPLRHGAYGMHVCITQIGPLTNQ